MSGNDQDDLLNKLLERKPSDIVSALTVDSDKYNAYQRLYFNYFDSKLANHMYYRNGDITDTSDKTWNGLFGGPSDTVRLHLFMRSNIGDLAEIFDPKVLEMFLSISQPTVNYDLTYDEAIIKLDKAGIENGKDYVAILKQHLEELYNPSTYTYLREIRIDHAHEMRIENINY